MKKTIFTILTLATVAIGGNAQTDTYTLSQCLKKGLENNYSLRITRNEEEIVHNNATLANAGYLPTVDLAPATTVRSAATTPSSAHRARPRCRVAISTTP